MAAGVPLDTVFPSYYERHGHDCRLEEVRFDFIEFVQRNRELQESCFPAVFPTKVGNQNWMPDHVRHDKPTPPQVVPHRHNILAASFESYGALLAQHIYEADRTLQNRPAGFPAAHRLTCVRM